MARSSLLLMVAGERSGDVYGGELATVLRARVPGLEIFGCGGDTMRRAGVETPVDAHQISMVGVTEVLSGLPRAYRALRLLAREAERRRPQLAVLIDFPDFNLRLARRLKKLNIPVVYFVSPQIWAWRRGRIKQIRANVLKMLCIFDFEEEIYRQAGVAVEYVGHPLVDQVRMHLTRDQFFAKAGLDPQTTTIGLFPGSRRKEVTLNLPTMLDAATRLALTRKIQFVVAAASNLDPRWMEALVVRSYVGRATVRIVTHLTSDALQHADLAVVASGTITLEAVLRERPMVVVYRVSALTWLVGRLLVDVPFFSMVNLLAQKPIVSEFIQADFTARKLAARIEYLLDHPEARAEMISAFRALRPRLGPGGAIERAAGALLEVLQATPAGT